MKTTKIILVTLAFTLVCGTANAQFGGLRRAVQRGVEKSVEKKAEEKAQEAADKAVEKALEPAERQRQRGEAELEKALNKADSAYQANEAAADAAEAKAIELAKSRPVNLANFTQSDVFFPVKEGTTQIFAQKNAKGKTQSQSRITVKKITGSGANFSIEYELETLDEKGKSLKDPLVIPYTMVVKDGIMVMDSKSIFGSQKGLEEGGAEITGCGVAIPADLKAGETLADAAMSVKIGFIRMSATITDVKCEAVEDISVEAGTFKAYKVSQNTTVNFMGKHVSKTVTYYAKGAGAVRTETYDAKDNLQQIEELVSVK
ncbi:MAG: hypothetical protein LBN23_08395 [Paludibacter sp.]|jgi:hypothetical protein|nr:hypothetical protein [Paludibacter sp.]